MTETSISQTTVLSQFLSSADDLAALVRSLPREMLDCAEAPGEWTIRQMVHHVADDADLWSFALKKAIANPGAPLRFEGFCGNDRWFEALAFGRRNIESSLDLIVTHRQVMTGIITYSKADWEASFVEVFDDKGQSIGKFNITQILTMLTGHLTEHFETIQRIVGGM